MPNLTLTIEDTSPLIIYSNDWTAGSSQSDSLIDRYSQGSYMSTNSDGGSLFFMFWGTAVQMFGSKRPEHGFYQISVDSQVYNPVNGKADPAVFRTTLFSNAAPFSNGPHTIRLTNTNNAPVDLDFISWQAPIGLDDEPLIVNTFQDTDESFKYSPTTAWISNIPDVGAFSGGTGHASSTPGSFLEYTFEGDAVSLFGPVGSNGGPYMVQIDNGLPNNYTTHKPIYRSNMLMYHTNGLGGGKHTVKLSLLRYNGSDSNESRPSVAIDYAQVYSTPSLGGRLLTLSTPGPKNDSLSPGAVSGITLAAFIGLLLLLSGLFLSYMRVYRRQTFRTLFDSETTTTPDKIPLQPFRYSTVSTSGDPHSPPIHDQTQSRTQEPYGLLPTPENSPLSPAYAGATSSGAHGAVASLSSQPHIQEISLPPRGSQKYRPDLIPRIQPPPPGQSLQRRQAERRRVEVGATHQAISPVVELEESLAESSAPPRYTLSDPSPHLSSLGHHDKGRHR